MLWAHNDSGGGAEVFAVGLDGSDQGRVELDGADAVDWEDIALVAGADGGPDRLLVADIGDNPGGGARTTAPVRLYRVDEPAAPGPGATGSAGPVTSIDLTYADGPRDAEALLADPLTGDVFVVSKQWDGSGAGVYVVPAAAVSAAGARAGHDGPGRDGGRHRGPPGHGWRRVGRRSGRGPAHLHRRDRVGARPVALGGRGPQRRPDLHACP